MPQVEVIDKITRLTQIAGVMLCIALLGVIAMLVGTAYGIHHSNAALRSAVDHDHQLLACYVRDQYDRTTRALPSNPYYKARPNDLKVALKTIREQRIKAVKTWGVCRTPEEK